MLFPTVAIIGMGQIGGSLALALANTSECSVIHGYDIDPVYADHIASQHEKVSVAVSLEDVVKHADLVVLCTPVRTYAHIMEQIAPYIKEGATITDIGSTKAQAVETIFAHLPKGVKYVPSHPIAGSERSGALVARADLFQERLFLITPPPGVSEAIYEPVANLWQAIGAQITLMPPEVHDQIYCYTSHVPHLCAFAACHMLAQQPEMQFHAHGEETLFARFIRIGRSDPQMWRDVALANAENMTIAFDQLLYLLNTMVAELMSESGERPSNTMPSEVATDMFPKIAASVMVTAASLCEQQINHSLKQYVGAGFHDFCAPITEDPDPSLEAISNHAKDVARLLSLYIDEIQAMKMLIAAQDNQALLTLLQHMQESGKRLIEPTH